MNYNSISTPFYVIRKEPFIQNLEKLKSSIEKYWNNYTIGYSYKTNAFPWILQTVNEMGCFAEVVSDDEYSLAQSLGVQNIIYNGVAKSKESFLEAVQNHQIVNIDSEYEIEWLDEVKSKNINVGIRVNFNLESFCPGQTQCGDDGERFGFCYENGELKKAIDRIEAKGVRVVGLHLHKSSKTRMPCIYSAIANIAVEIASKYDLVIEYIDIGGGFFGGLSTKPQFDEYFALVSSILKQRFEPKTTKLIVEPGMALVGAYIDYVTSVKDVKKNVSANYIVTDGSRTQIDPLMTKQSYFFEVVKNDKNDETRNIIDRQIISGFTCMEHDRLFEINNQEALLPGDIIIYNKVGAYTMCLSPLFIKWFPKVYLEDDGQMMLLRDKWTSEEYKKCYIF